MEEQTEYNIRKQKLRKLIRKGINPYPNKFITSHNTQEVTNQYSQLVTGEKSNDVISIPGRIVSRREMGRATFAHLLDYTGKLQIYLREETLGKENYDLFLNLIDIGDYIGCEGTPFRTKTGELTLFVTKWSLLSKALRPLPEKWHGLRDIETRYRQRYLDLITNTEVKNIFYLRAQIISTLRDYLNRNDFIEVETPIIQTLPGGALAKPFKTFHNAYNLDLYLRIAPELSLKLLVIGGLEKVYELGRSFRNEGVDSRHNTEFTMLEVYQAYTNYTDMMDLCEKLVMEVVNTAIKKNEVVFGDKKISFKAPFKRIKLSDLFKEKTNADIFDIIGNKQLNELAKKMQIDLPEGITEKKIFDHLFEKIIQPELIEPTFVTDYPTAFSPLAKGNETVAERFELFIAGEEIANAYSELNDPEEQRKRFLQQKQDRADEEAHLYDENFITALEYGMPPCGGLGIGIDRLVMVLLGKPSIREVLLFPLLKPE